MSSAITFGSADGAVSVRAEGDADMQMETTKRIAALWIMDFASFGSLTWLALGNVRFKRLRQTWQDIVRAADEFSPLPRIFCYYPFK
jgi:hypothetical protein